MSNYILLCHGELKEFSSFTLGAGQSVQYRGKYGTNLSGDIAKALVGALRSDPCVTDEHLAAQIRGYTAQGPLEAGKTYAPDIRLWGTDNPLCFLMRMEGRRPWIRLGPEFASTLGKVMASLGSPVWLNLLCCTELPDVEIAQAYVKDGLQVKNWENILHA
jgi:hypothetical protein